MMTKVMVSVVIPFLNRSEWLIEAVSSVKQQTFADWELLLIDDGSLSKHSSVAKSLADNKKIFYHDHVNHENRGVSLSRNLGAANAKGKYIAFLDADDCWLPEKLERQLKLFAENPAAEMICEFSLFWNSWNGNGRDEIVAVGAPSDTLYFPPALTTILYPLGDGAAPCPSGIIVTKKLLRGSVDLKHPLPVMCSCTRTRDSWPKCI